MTQRSKTFIKEFSRDRVIYLDENALEVMYSAKSCNPSYQRVPFYCVTTSNAYI